MVPTLLKSVGNFSSCEPVLMTRLTRESLIFRGRAAARNTKSFRDFTFMLEIRNRHGMIAWSGDRER